jgi:membrane protein
MAGESMSKWRRICAAVQNSFDERRIEFTDTSFVARLQRRVHFWVLVSKSFVRNRCPVRAAALSYTTLLALVPLLAVVVSVTTSMLQKQGEEPVAKLISKFVNYVAPALDLEARAEETPVAIDTNAVASTFTNGAGGLLTSTNAAAGSTNAPAISGRDRVVKQITAFIANVRTGTLTATGAIALLFVGISLLRTIEATFNDIWGVTKCRGWFKSIVYYWAAITLGPLLLIAALALTSGPHVESTHEWLNRVPFLGGLLFRVLPFVVLSLGFAGFYAAMPNTKVHFEAALVGGIVGGCLWQLNNIFSVIYVSRVMTYANIYGSLAVVPLLLVGMYFSWLIMLLGAQVAYAHQNREAYVQEKQAESVNQRGREFIALRLMTHIARNFSTGAQPLSLIELSRQLAVPSQLAYKVLAQLAQAGLVVEVTDTETRFTPGRPLDRISAYDVVSALRTGNGQELETAEDDSRLLVRAEYERIILAEREAGNATTMQSLAELSAKQIGNGNRGVLEAGLPKPGNLVG